MERTGLNQLCPIQRVGARISLLMAIDTDGRTYTAMSHANTNGETFRLFLWKLINKLTEE